MHAEVNPAEAIGQCETTLYGVAQTTCCLGAEGTGGIESRVAHTTSEPLVASQHRQQVVGATQEWRTS